MNIDERLLSGRFAFVLIGLVAVIAHVVALATPLLLDEQYMLAWAAHANSGAELLRFLQWNGPIPADLWGPATPLFIKLTQIVYGGVPFLIRLKGVATHVCTSLLAFLVLRRLTGRHSIGLVSALLFASYPLSAEAVSWLGGRGSELAGFYFLASLYCYLRGRNITLFDGSSRTLRFQLQWIGAAFLLYLCALLSSASIWTSTLVFALVETVAAATTPAAERAKEMTSYLVGPLLVIVATAAYFAANNMFWQLTSYEAGPFLSVRVFQKTLATLLFPINRPNWHGYKLQFGIMYGLLVPLTIGLLSEWKLNARARGSWLLMLGWFLLALLPALGHIATHTNLFGSHLLYLSLVPFCALLGTGIVGFGSLLAVTRAERLAAPAIAFVTAAFCFFYSAHAGNENSIYRVGGRLLQHVQQSLHVVASKSAANYVLTHGVPAHISVCPAWSPDGIVVWDAKTNMLAASNVSAGSLKDQLRDGKFADSFVDWRNDLMRFVNFSFGDRKSNFPSPLDANGIAIRFVPPMEYYKIASFDPATRNIVLNSNAGNGPSFNFLPDGLNPLDGDFFGVMAKIDAPPSVKPEIELYWHSGEHLDYDSKERKVTTKAIMNDGKFHEYYLSLRSPGWISNGMPTEMTLGFPASAKVELSKFFIAKQSERCPKFEIQQEEQRSAKRFTPPYSNYPNLPELGLYRVPEGSSAVIANHDSTNIDGAVGVIVEISDPDKAFPNPNSSEFSGVGFKTIAVTGSKGTYRIPLADLPRSGVYSMRAIAMDAGHNPLGNFSDSVYLLVRRPIRNGWSEQ